MHRQAEINKQSVLDILNDADKCHVNGGWCKIEEAPKDGKQTTGPGKIPLNGAEAKAVEDHLHQLINATFRGRADAPGLRNKMLLGKVANVRSFPLFL